MESIKNILVISLFTVSFNASAVTQEKEILVQQCRDLSENILTLISSQGKKPCVEKLNNASIEMDAAGDWVVNDNIPSAKQELENAIYSLQHAELNSCNRYIQISHAKFEAQRIRATL